MKKLFWSSFAVSLILQGTIAFSQTEAIDDFLGMESELLPELEGAQKFTPRDYHTKKEWNVKEEEVETDSTPLKGQGYSLIPWKTLDPEEWMSFKNWEIERGIKDQIPDWKVRLRKQDQKEHIGKILQCIGKCEVFRGIEKVNVEHLSRLHEEDELKTDVDSIAWVFLMDGTLVRVGPSSMVSFQEINLSRSEVFHLVRLGQGHIFWHPRSDKEFSVEYSPETDAISLPLLVREANQQCFERQLFQSQSDPQRLAENLNLEEAVISQQVKKINELRKSNGSITRPESKVMIYSPNGTLVSKNMSLDLFYYPGGKAYFKKRHPQEGAELSLYLRGYSSKESLPITEESWHEIAPDGRSFAKVDSTPGGLEVAELITRRIKTFELARELWIERYTTPILESLKDPQTLATQHGYSLWESKMPQRFEFLLEYTRRMETTNLKSLDNLLKKLEANGETIQKEVDDSHFRATINYYLKGLKSRYTDKNIQVREMNDLQYYIWILRHGNK